MRRITWLSLSAALIAAAGCSDKGDPASPGPGAEESDADTDADADADTDADTDADPIFEEYVEPEMAVPDEDGAYNISIAPTEITIDGERYCVRAYNGMVPGPTIRVPRGEDRQLRMNLRNDFSEMDERIVVGDEGYGAERCYDFNLTNLHAHGFHVRPDYSVGGSACEGEGCASNPADGDGLANDYYADNVLIELPFGESAQYRFDIDEDHVHDAGLYWYHPHIHGSTGVQVGGGAAGAIVIEGEYDELAMFEGATDRLMIFNQIPWQVEELAADGTPLVTPLEDGEACTEETISVNNFLSLAKYSTPLVNGVYRPQIESPPGQVERWRLLHAGVGVEMVVGIFPSDDPSCAAPDLTTPWPTIQVAADGIPFPQSWERDWLFLAPGYRMEILVQVPESGRTLCVLSGTISTTLTTEGLSFEDQGDYLLFSVRSTEEAGEATLAALLSPSEIDAQLATVARETSWTGTVNGEEGVDVSCEDVDSGPLAEDPEVFVMVHPVTPLQAEDAEVQSSAGECDGQSGHDHGDHEPETDPCTCPLPNFNCRNFNVRHAFETDDGRAYRSDRVLIAGESQHWEVSATDAHPFHIHVNPFVVCPASSNKEPPFPHWRDTYFMQFDDQAANGFEPVHVLSRYAEIFTGQYVDHCHKLNHEDEGMMELVEICQPGDTACLCLDGETDESGDCIESNAGCYDGDTQCLYAEYMMDGFGPDVMESPVLTENLSAEERNDMMEAGLEECCAEYPEFGTEAELIDYLAALTGVAPTCCPDDLSAPWPPGHPCDQ